MRAVATARETLEGLVTPRRLLPILIVLVPLLLEQAHWGGSRALTIGLALGIACVVVAPVTWRIFGGAKPTISGIALYAFVGAITVGIVGYLGPPLVGLRGTFLTHRHSIPIVLALFLVGGWGLGRDIELERSLDAQRARADALARAAERAEILALRAHLDPHFLFNTLNAIAEWCRVDGVVAERAVLRLAEMLRAILDGVRHETWPLSRERALVEALFELHRMRDPDRFSIAVEADPGIDALGIPPLLLVAIAENAMKHGPGRGHRGIVRLSIRREAERLVIRLSNPGPYAGPRHGGEGLPTIDKRLSLTYGEGARFTIGPDGDGRTIATLEIPGTLA
jgi:hypothetical protein